VPRTSTYRASLETAGHGTLSRAFGCARPEKSGGWAAKMGMKELVWSQIGGRNGEKYVKLGVKF